MKDKVLQWCREQQLFRSGQTVVCAVSGGKDSVCMLHLLLSLQSRLQIRIEACHFNHRLRGAESDRDEAFVRRLCREWSVPLAVGSGDVRARAEQTGESIEEAARNLRYGFFASLGKTVATAHTRDDLTETVLLNLLRGTGLKGLCGIPPKRDDLVRPLLCLSRQEVDAYLAENGLAHTEDSSNAGSDYLRNRLRHAVVPLLKEENPSLSAAVFRMSRTLWEDESLLQSMAEAALHDASQPDGSLLCGSLTGLPASVRKRALRTFLQTVRAPKLSAAHIDAVDRLLYSANPSAACDLPGGWQARREYERLYLTAESSPGSFSPLPLIPGTAVQIPETGMRIRVGTPGPCEAPLRSPSAFPVRLDSVDTDTLCVRPRQEGDGIRLSGGTKTVKKLLIDRKVPADVRDTIPVIADSRGVIAVYKIGIHADRAAKPGEQSLTISIEKEENERYD